MILEVKIMVMKLMLKVTRSKTPQVQAQKLNLNTGKRDLTVSLL
jgi:hypothetical protein